MRTKPASHRHEEELVLSLLTVDTVHHAEASTAQLRAPPPVPDSLDGMPGIIGVSGIRYESRIGNRLTASGFYFLDLVEPRFNSIDWGGIFSTRDSGSPVDRLKDTAPSLPHRFPFFQASKIRSQE
jgi:hypothetical protein